MEHLTRPHITKPTVPYKDTHLTFYHYKEPLKQVHEGFGYEGALLGTLDGEKIQCHICGDLFTDLAGHATKTHKELTPTARDYKERFGLAFSSALVSEAERARMKMVGMLWWHRLSPEKRAEHIRRSKAKRAAWYKKKIEARSKTHPKHQLETKNKRGTCPDQLLERVREVTTALGRTPSKSEFIDHFDSQRYLHLIYATFGSWRNAVQRAGLSAKQQELTLGKRKPRQSNDELLDLLSVFHQENGRIPSYTDCRRGLLPSSDIYIRRFGSISEARRLAGIHLKPTRWGEKML